MADTVAVEETALTSLNTAYTTLAQDVKSASQYISANCELTDASGLLLAPLQPAYNACRDIASQAVASLGTALTGLATQVSGALSDAEKTETANKSVTNKLDQILAELAQINAKLNGGGGGGGSYSGGGGAYTGGGGGAYTGGGGSSSGSGTGGASTASLRGSAEGAIPTPSNTTNGAGAVPAAASVSSVAPAHAPTTSIPAPATTPAPAGDFPAPAGGSPTWADGSPAGAGSRITVDVQAGGQEDTVTVSGAGNVSVTVDAAGTAGAGPVDVSVTVDGDATSSPALDASSFSQPSSGQLDSMAATDPLGRSASELQDAWQSREPLSFDDASSSGLISDSASAGAGIDMTALMGLVQQAQANAAQNGPSWAQ